MKRMISAWRLDLWGRDMLARIMGQTVIDRTRLTGTYDFDFEWPPESMYETPVDAEPASRLSIFAAIEQLGQSRGPSIFS
jgi:uncharacterized protein (TIGR03435 family)